ncbi:type II toxin-antitoxin system HicB family antitoxin [Moorena sp. SIO3I6]|uniref:type II toxin-antitoxin system HicB family antitoxin n=1 Tax=Moorena sp. SIO3I6 TaxID=2607831 RepID=UPI0013F890EB|nr:type II toxin-antitoxin system HicB family antitoxin [Moorena sp. SIO3I6]NEP29119.1 type II toxin-antitoxin system HicB family antitoxin [Moorena sp. SIO3I6]
MQIKVAIHPAEEGGFWAEVPALPGCITEGDTMEEVLANLQDAIEGWLEVASNSYIPEPNSKIVEVTRNQNTESPASLDRG